MLACAAGDKASGTMWTTNCTNVAFDFDGSVLEVSCFTDPGHDSFYAAQALHWPHCLHIEPVPFYCMHDFNAD